MVELEKKDLDRYKKIKEVAANSLNLIKTKISKENSRDISLKFYDIVKHAFTELFEMDSEFTYEDLIFKIKNMQDILDDINKQIEGIENNIDKVYVEEKNDEVIRAKVTALQKDLNIELAREKKYIGIASTLEDTKATDDLITFSEQLSRAKYGNEDISKEKLLEIIKNFEDILGKFIEDEEVAQKGETGNSGKIYEIIKIAKSELKKKEVDNAKKSYLKIIKIYLKLHYREKKIVYSDIQRLYRRIKG